MVFKFLSNLWLTSDEHEYSTIKRQDLVKLNISIPSKSNVEITSHAFLNVKTILVLYSDIRIVIEYLKEFIILHGGGHSYIQDVESIIKMNLGEN